MKTLVFLVRLFSWFATVSVAYQWGRSGSLDVVGATSLGLFFIATLLHLVGDWQE